MYRKSLKAIIAVLALAYAFEASADAYSRISLSEANTPIDEVLKKIEKDKTASEDDVKKAVEEIQKLTDKYIKEVDHVMQAKEKEIMEV